MTSAADAADLFQEHRDELGFVNQAQCSEKDLLTERRDGEIVGALLGNHCVRKHQSTVYELAVRRDYRRQGIATKIIRRFAAESPHDRLVAKCPADLPAVEFYQSAGWNHVGREEGKHRPLEVFEYDAGDTTTVYMTVYGSQDAISAIQRSPARVGASSEVAHRVPVGLEFVDFPFTDEDATFEDHLAVVREHEPRLTVAPDVECGRTLEEVVCLADRLDRHAETVIVVPKDCHPSEVPDRHRVGLTVGSFGSMAPWGLWQYRNAGPVHLLGGSPTEQLAVRDHGIDVASVDGFALGRRARFGAWDGGAVDAEDYDYEGRLKMSLDNYTDAWNRHHETG